MSHEQSEKVKEVIKMANKMDKFNSSNHLHSKNNHHSHSP